MSDYCAAHQITLPTLRRVLIAGAPVRWQLVEGVKQCLGPEADVHTPYGATEALPVASICGEVFGNDDGGALGQGLVQFDTKGYDLGEYISRVLRVVERNWKMNIPPAARVQGVTGAVFVSISIDRNHDSPDEEKAIIVVHQAWSSGKPAFDQSALLALEISSPLPPIPAFFPHDKLEGRLGFLYNLDPDQVTFPVQR